MGAPSISPATYKLNPALWEKNRIMIKRLNMAVVFGPVGAVALIMLWRSNFAFARLPLPLFATWILTLLIICGVGWFFALGRIDKAAKKYHSFELSVLPEGLARRQAYLPDLFVPFGDISKVQVIAGKGTMVHTRRNGAFLWIADELVGYDEICQLLRSKVSGYAETKQPPWWYRPWLMLTIGLVSFAFVLFASDARVVLIASAIYLVAMASDWIKVLRGSSVDKQQKRKLFLLTPFVLLIIGYRIWTVLHR